MEISTLSFFLLITPLLSIFISVWQAISNSQTQKRLKEESQRLESQKANESLVNALKEELQLSRIKVQELNNEQKVMKGVVSQLEERVRQCEDDKSRLTAQLLARFISKDVQQGV